MSRQQRRALDRAAARRGRPQARSRWRTLLAGGAVALAAGGWFALTWLRDQPPTREGAPSWSPDGEELVFYAEQPPAGIADLFVMNRDGAEARPLFTTPNASEGSPTFSPDGLQIAFDSDEPGNFEIHVARADGSARRRLTRHPGRDLAPAWSPDGQHLVFMSDRDSRPDFDVYRMNAADGSSVERLTKGGTHWFPQYSPDGTRLAMHVGRDVHVLDLTTRRMRRLTTDPLNGMYPTWSPDGQRIAFMSWRSGRTEIFTMNANGTEQELLVSMPRGSAIDPRWSPDGEWIAFVHVPEETVHDAQNPEQNRLVYVVEVASGRMRRLSR